MVVLQTSLKVSTYNWQYVLCTSINSGLSFFLYDCNIKDSVVFTIPGLYNSGPQHWQTHWEKEYGFTRILQKEWDTPVCNDWITTIDNTVTQHNLSNVILVGHSLACATIVQWSNTFKRVIKGALLVATSDVDASSYPKGTTGFMPMPLHRLPFPSIIIAHYSKQILAILGYSIARALYFDDIKNSGCFLKGYAHFTFSTCSFLNTTVPSNTSTITGLVLSMSPAKIFLLN